MIYLKVRQVGIGMHPDERLVEFSDADDNTTQTFAWSRQINDRDYLTVSDPLQQRAEDGAYLIQLPQETIAGYWRVWIQSSELAYD